MKAWQPLTADELCLSQGIQDRIGILFFIAIFTAFGNMLQVINTFPAEKAIVNRERSSKSYRVSAYFLSKVLAETPLRILAALIFSSIVYWMVRPFATAHFLCIFGLDC